MSLETRTLKNPPPQPTPPPPPPPRRSTHHRCGRSARRCRGVHQATGGGVGRAAVHGTGVRGARAGGGGGATAAATDEVRGYLVMMVMLLLLLSFNSGMSVRADPKLGDSHRSPTLLMLFWSLMLVSVGQCVIMCVIVSVSAWQCVQTSSTASSSLLR